VSCIRQNGSGDPTNPIVWSYCLLCHRIVKGEFVWNLFFGFPAGLERSATLALSNMYITSDNRDPGIDSYPLESRNSPGSVADP
jgi:hypothetical protein